MFDKELNCLPNSICEIILPNDYRQEIKQIPSSLKKIVCSKLYKFYCLESYKFINKFNNIDIEFY